MTAAWLAVLVGLLAATPENVHLDEGRLAVRPGRLQAPVNHTPARASAPRRPDGQPFSTTACGVIDVESGQILYAENLTERRFPASLTKVVTAMVALDAVAAGEASLNDLVVVSEAADATRESSLWLSAGEELTLRDLLIGILLRSANDASHALAEHLGGGNAQVFIDRMNERMGELGAIDSHFVNPHGLHWGLREEPIGEQHYSTGYDLLLAALQAWRHPFFQNVVGLDSARVSWQNLDPENLHEDFRSVGNYNRLLKLYPEAIGIKTGRTKQAGSCLLSAARRGDREVIAVTLGSPTAKDRYQESEALLRYGLDEFEPYRLLEPGETCDTVLVEDGRDDAVPAISLDGLTVVVHRGETAPWITVSTEPRLVAPVPAGLPVGWARVELPGGTQRVVRLVAGRTVSRERAAGPGRVAWLMSFSVLIGIVGYGTAAETYRRRGSLLPPRRRSADHRGPRGRQREDRD